MTDEQLPGGGHDDPLLRAVAGYWDDIRRLADPRQLERLTGLLAGTAEADPGVARAALTDTLLDVLPPSHPLIEQLRSFPAYASGRKTGQNAVKTGERQAAGSVILFADDTGTAPVTVYLTDEHFHAQVESALEALFAAAGLRIVDRDDPVIGSWFRRMTVRAADGMRSPTSQAEVTAKLLENLAPVISALQPVKGAVIRVGALLVVKQDDDINVLQLTAPQQAWLDQHPRLAWSPGEIAAALSLVPDGRPGPGPHDAAAVLDLYVEEPVFGQDSRFLREAGVSFGQPRVAPVPDDELPSLADKRWPALSRMRIFQVTLPFDLEEPPDGCRYTETTVRMSFDGPGIVAMKLSGTSGGIGEDDSVLDTRGVGRQQLTWKLSARDEQSNLRPSGREVQAVVAAPIAAERLTGTLDAKIRFTRPESSLVKRFTAEPQQPLRFALDVTDGTFETLPEENA